MRQLIIASIPMIELVLESLDVNAFAIQIQMHREKDENHRLQLQKRLQEIEDLANHCNTVISNLK